MGNSGIREFALRYDILRGGIKYAEAKAAGPAAVSMDMRRKIKRLFSGDLILPEGMDRLGDRLRPVLILDKAEYPLGQFILTTVKAVREGASCFCRCEGYDLCFLAQRTRLEQKLYFSAGERYTDRIQALLQQCGIQSAIVEESDEMFATDREDWVQKKLAAGMQVLIVNPSLVETGLDLNAFTTLVFYSMGYKLFTLRQASRRSWRINQKAPAVKVYMLYYEDTMQQKCLKLMASKLAVAGLIEGNFSEEGLAAMSDVQDMTSQMAKELMLGIRDNVEDIAAAFKKMAFENPDREVPDVPAKETSLPPESVPAMIEQPKRVLTAEQEEKLQAAMVQLEQQKAKRTKKTQQVENQLSLFDSVA